MSDTPKSKENRNRKRREFQKTIFKDAPIYSQRVCKGCNKLKEHRRCGVSSGGTIQYRSKCNECHQKEQNYTKYNGPDREKYRQRRLKRIRQSKQRCVDYLGGMCCKCGYNKSLRALTFHHKIRSDKEYDMSVIKDHKWDKVKTELDKCVLICFNCHMEEEETYDVNKGSNIESESANQDLVST